MTHLVLTWSLPASAIQEAADTIPIVASDTAWMLVSTALVLLMTPALAFFYAGMVRSKNALNTLMMSFISLGFVSIAWVAVGYSIAFGGDGLFFGDWSMVFLDSVNLDAEGTIPELLFMAFQGTFVIITAALISGAVVERMRFGPYLAFIVIWTIAVYAPVCHWVWGGGWIGELGALDFAGGAVVHVNAAAAALVAAIVLGPRRDYGRQALLPHNVPLVLLGTGLLWFGWFGFNGGSALAANESAVLAFVNTMFAPAATLVTWTILDHFVNRKVTAIGAATAIVVGLVAVTPAAGFVSPASALLIGGLAAIPSYLIIEWRARTHVDDSLDVFAAHGVGGLTGAVLVGIFADAAWNGSTNGLLFGNPGQVLVQIATVAVVFAYSGLLTFVILKALSFVTDLRVQKSDEAFGLDVIHHGEKAYSTGEGAILLLDHEIASPPVISPSPTMHTANA